MTYITQEAISLIKKFESYSPTIYLCPAGYKTIGYGHVIKKNEYFYNLSLEEAEKLLLNDMLKIEKFILKSLKISVSIGQINALISFAFNVGNAAFQRSTLRQKINSKNFEEVPREFRRWIKARGRILKGLVRRREEEIKMFYS
ncbi:MAG: lysozyme [Alphaproteobacteria bacterium]